MSKDKSKSSKTGALVMVLLVLWLAGLTAVILIYLQKPAAGDLDTRVAKLEAKANSLVGKIHPPGSKELNSLEGRVAHLKKRINALASDDSQPVTAEPAGCDCEKLKDRLAALETAVDSQFTATTVSSARAEQALKTEMQPQAAETRAAGRTRSDAPEKSTPLPKKTAAKSKFKSAAGKMPVPQQPRTDMADGDASRSTPDYESRDLHDMNRRYVPIYQGSSDDASGQGLLGPGSGGYQ